MPTNKFNHTAGKSTARFKSTTRKPLRDVSNATMVKPLGTSFKTKKIHGRENDAVEQVVGEVNVIIDRLLLIRSDFSSVINQIDEVVQVLKLGGKKNGREIESFAHVLCEMQASLKPWVPKFQKTLSDLSTRPEYEHSRPSEAIPLVADNINNAVDSFDDVESPEQSKWDSLVSPSPLVSWRAGCTTEGGRQLFLLTPLPHPKVLSSKCQGSSKKLEKDTSNTNAQQDPLFDTMGDIEDRLLENTKAIQNIASATASQPPSLSDVTVEMDILHVSDEVESIPTKVSDNDMTINEVTRKRDLISPVKLPQIDNSLLVMTPCLKISPPKTCVLLEPSTEYNCRDRNGAYKMTPFPVARHFSTQDSESSSSEAAEHLTKKYPELFGIRLSQNLTNRGKAADESPDLLFSPPKTCVLMELPVEEPLTNAAETDGNLDIVETTPMMTESKSIVITGKHPGENTLKKELWVKFEAASRNGIRFNPSTIQKTSEKGFLERLEEVSNAEEEV
ncbi:uncharacterized protein [Nicotiana tomentosiformis]|uniref:uncharacterized protein isoform X1 n=1 Tax=Nicotiana tomentosiformis TaxID=4098 RepID=UPI00051BB1B0|nr:uncharacterized protein LOC104094467 isoform X1 [Nicotiana tomentosiformis]